MKTEAKIGLIRTQPERLAAIRSWKRSKIGFLSPTTHSFWEK